MSAAAGGAGAAAATCAEAVLEFDGAAAAAAAAAGGAAAAAAGPLRLYVRAQVVMLGGVETLLVRATEMVDAADLPPPGAEGEAPGGPTGAAALDRFGRIWQDSWEQLGPDTEVEATPVLEALQKGEVEVRGVSDAQCRLKLGGEGIRVLKALKVANTSGTGTPLDPPAELRLYEQLRGQSFGLNERLCRLESAALTPVPFAANSFAPWGPDWRRHELRGVPGHARSALLRLYIQTGKASGTGRFSVSLYGSGAPDVVLTHQFKRDAEAAFSSDNDTFWLSLKPGDPAVWVKVPTPVPGSNLALEYSVVGYR